MTDIPSKLLNRPLVLIGLMGAGKTTIGKKIADLLSIPFIDSDKEIETTAGCSIADIFEQYGEEEFRRVENQVIQRLLDQAPLILATGGGAYMHPETRKTLKEKATTLWLHCDLETLFKRVSKNTNRPLLNVDNKKEILSSLMKKRYPVYAEADIVVECKDKDIDTTINLVISALENSSKMHILPITLSKNHYDVIIGSDILQQCGTLILPLLKQKKVFILADQTVADLHLDKLIHSLDLVHVNYEVILLPPGEKTKSFQYYEKVTHTLLEKGVERNSTILAFGGGVAGDLAGFSAATVLRGVPFIQIPTTLLSQVDSSVGGKTGINTSVGKNLLGAFYQPEAVLADTKILDTLPQRELQAGYAEIVKAGLINDPELFKWCEKNGKKVISKEHACLAKAIEMACQFKARIIQNDEYEQQSTGRNLLNLGHSLGHTLEAELGYDGRLLHGEAVALGCCLIFKLCTQMGICPEKDTQRVIHHFESVNLPVTIKRLPQPIRASNLLNHLKHDKKSQNNKITFILVNGIGKAFTSQDVSEKQLYNLLIEDGCIQD
ncbi:3-dehydroquinate synthase [Commensalibacter melissae]|uniref:3-dehydroquinate synthase n=1 Tax=Commensalibacter melissae TaxID=2070537 RepID=UPI0012D8611E|nr:3-dehydroquinate synthase [Commensalibacter melissae]MUG09535.1 3-dehydroquinate synthase [Commensalibacter melissae]